MGLKDFFKQVRAQKFSKKTGSTTNNGLPDAEIAANWIKCKSCSATIHKSDFEKNLNICTECGFHGRIGLRQRIELLTDNFDEIDEFLSSSDPLAFNDGKPYPQTLAAAKKKTGRNDAISTGFAEIEGIKVALAVMDFDFLGGSMGSVVGEKFVRIVEAAIKKQLPFICVSSSGGARMHEGILSLMQMAKTSMALSKLSAAGLPFFSLLTDPTYGGVSASFATLGDLILAEPGARIGFAGRRVIEETVREKLPSDFQSAEYLLEHGQIDLIIDRRELKTSLAKLLRMHGFVSENFVAPTSTAGISVGQYQVEQPKKEIVLEFEKPLQKIQDEIQTLQKSIKNDADHVMFEKLKEQYSEVEKNIYNNLTPIDITRIARHPNRPNAQDYLNAFCGKDKWFELHGDRAGTDDQAIMTAFAELDGIPFLAVATRKGRTIRENQDCNFGMPQPEGYRKARRVFEYANKFNLPVITFIDTPGAYPGLRAEANGQSIAIAENLKTLAELEVPVLAVVTGEGGSGGALAIGVANKILMLENSIYSVISPEGCAAILWRTRDKAPEAAQALKLTAKDLKGLGVIDEIIKEPMGGAHKNWAMMFDNLKDILITNLRELRRMQPKDLYNQKIDKFYAYGTFLQTTVQ